MDLVVTNFLLCSTKAMDLCLALWCFCVYEEFIYEYILDNDGR